METRTRVKICGITDPEDGRRAAMLGVDAIGLVFHPDSPRALETARAREIVAALPPFVTSVALFLDPEPTRVERVLETVRPDMLQFHGSESAAFCEGFGVPYLKAIAMGGETGPEAQINAHPAASGYLLDSHVLGGAGGSGQAFDWTRVPSTAPGRMIIAGGLAPGNVARAIAETCPYGVDVSSGVESAPGIKDHGKMAAFIHEVNHGNGD